jgi:hypothetical protein
MPIQPRTGEKRKQMKTKSDFRRHRHAGMYDEARLRSGVCIAKKKCPGVECAAYIKAKEVGPFKE